MSKLPVVKALDLIKYLNKKGFVCIHVKGSHHIFRSNDRHTTVPVHGNSEIGKGLLKAILAEAGISMDEFKQEWCG